MGYDIFPHILSYTVFIDYLYFHSSAFLNGWQEQATRCPAAAKEQCWRQMKRFV